MNFTAISDEDKRIIENNQMLFIQQFERSLIGQCYLLGWRLSGRRKVFETDRKGYVAYINRLKMKNALDAFIMRMRGWKFHLTENCPPLKIEKHRDELAICAIIKNEGSYLKEWIEFHLLQGVERFYLLDNGSTDNTKEVLKPYIDRKLVCLIPFIGEGAQIVSYNDLLRAVKRNVKWVAIIDADEFLFATDGQDLKECLKEYEAYPGVAVNWVVYGTCGNEKKPDGLVLEHYRETYANRNHNMNLRVKMIVHPSKVLYYATPHSAFFRNGELPVDENKNTIDGTALLTMSRFATTESNSIQRLRINHYWTKSMEELEQKCAKGRADQSKDLAVSDALHRLEGEKVIDTVSDQFIPEMKKRMQIAEL